MSNALPLPACCPSGRRGRDARRLFAIAGLVVIMCLFGLSSFRPPAGTRMDCPATRFELLKFMSKQLSDRGTVHFAIYGTLLGGYRDGHVIPWTHDVDLYVPIQHREALQGIDCITFIADPLSKVSQVRSLGPMERVAPWYMFWEYPYGYMDVYGSPETTPPPGGPYSVPTKTEDLQLTATAAIVKPGDIYPLTTVNVEGVDFPAPRNIVLVLERIYGKSWRVPDPKKSLGGTQVFDTLVTPAPAPEVPAEGHADTHH